MPEKPGGEYLFKSYKHTMQSDIYMIAEIGQAHDGSLGLAHSYIDALADTGVNAVKFQVHIAEAESSIYEPFRTRFSYLDEKRMEYWKRIEFTPDQWHGLKIHCERKNLEFLATPSCLAAVDLLNDLGVDKIKVGSGDSNNLLLLQHILKAGKKIILSSGISSIDELDKTITFLKTRNGKFSLLQCTTAYPTTAQQWGLNVISELKNRYKIPVGFSDHSGDIFACLAAASLGAEILEFHVVFDNRMFGPDSKSSINIAQVTTLVQGVRQIEMALNNPVSKDNYAEFSGLKDIFEKSLATTKNLPEGHRLTLDDLESKKPKNMGISANSYEGLVGKAINKNLSQWSFITENDLQ